MFDLDDNPLGWPCDTCSATTPAPGLCSECLSAHLAEQARRHEQLWRTELVWRFEIGEDAYSEALVESGMFDWPRDQDERIAAIEARAQPVSPSFYRVGLPDSLEARAETYARIWRTGRSYAIAPDGRRAPLGWCPGGLPNEVPVVPAGEHFDFEPDTDWFNDDWLDENGRMHGKHQVRYERPVISVPVGDRL